VPDGWKPSFFLSSFLPSFCFDSETDEHQHAGREKRYFPKELGEDKIPSGRLE